MTLFEPPETLVFEIARLHFRLGQEQVADFVIERNVEFFVPLPPKSDRAFLLSAA